METLNSEKKGNQCSYFSKACDMDVKDHRRHKMSQKSDKFTLLGEIFLQIFFRSKTSNGPKNNVYLLLFFYLFGPDWMRSRYSQKCLETF